MKRYSRDERRLWEMLLLTCKRGLECEIEKLELTSPHVRDRLQDALAQFREWPAYVRAELPGEHYAMELAQFVELLRSCVSRAQTAASV